MLQSNHHDFVPHTFTVGDTFQTNFSLFSYGIISAYSRGGSHGGSPEVGQDIRSFEYMNYGFRTCDVVDLSLGINLLDFSDITAKASKRFLRMMDCSLFSIQALISCWFPVFYQLKMEFDKPGHWGSAETDYLEVKSTLMGLPDDVVCSFHPCLMLRNQSDPNYTVAALNRRYKVCHFFHQVRIIAYLLDFLLRLTHKGNTISILNYTYRQCCETCDSHHFSQLETYELPNPPNSDPFYAISTPLRYTRPPCANETVQFKAVDGFILGNISAPIPYEFMTTGMLIDLFHTKL